MASRSRRWCPAPGLARLLVPGPVDEDAAHGLSGCSEEVAAAVPPPGLVHVHQAEVGFVDQGRRLQRLARLFLGQLLGSQLALLLVDQGQEFPGGGRVAILDGGQDAGKLIHRFLSPNQGICRSLYPRPAASPGLPYHRARYRSLIAEPTLRAGAFARFGVIDCARKPWCPARGGPTHRVQRLPHLNGCHPRPVNARVVARSWFSPCEDSLGRLRSRAAPGRRISDADRRKLTCKACPGG
jgi:hypothetical protein